MSMSADRAHWDRIFSARAEGELTWFEETPSLSLELVRSRLEPGEPFIDVGGGASRLVDALLSEGHGPLTVLDLSPAALAVARRRLGPKACDVAWVDADATDWRPDRRYAVWHDRAVFHFLTRAEERAGYARSMADALRPGGSAIIATFADDGPGACSGLPVLRYSPEDLSREFDRLLAGSFECLEARRHVHVTPKGARQNFQYSVLRKRERIASSM